MRVCLPLADGFEDLEAISVIDILRRVGVSVEVVGIPGSTVTSRSGMKIMVDKRMGQMRADDYDGLVLVGGGKNVEMLGRTSSIVDMAKNLSLRNKLVAAICVAPSILAKAGLLEDRKATIYPGMERELPKPRSEKIVVDKNIVTSQGPGTSVEFALKLAELLTNKARAEKVRQAIVA